MLEKSDAWCSHSDSPKRSDAEWSVSSDVDEDVVYSNAIGQNKELAHWSQ